jgi:hypothetical protein
LALEILLKFWQYLGRHPEPEGLGSRIADGIPPSLLVWVGMGQVSNSVRSHGPAPGMQPIINDRLLIVRVTAGE